MASLQDGVPRKRITTYGKAVRRRIPEPTNFASMTNTKSQPFQLSSSRVSQTPDSPPPRSTTSHKLEPMSQRTRRTSPQSPGGADVFDVPLSGDERPAPTHKPHKQALKPVPRRRAPKNPSPASPPVANVFDVPMGDDETPTPTPIPQNHTLKLRAPISTITKETLNYKLEDMEQNKRVKVSPSREPTLKQLPTNTKVRPLKAAYCPAGPKRGTPPRKASTTKIVSRPKPEVPRKNPEQPQTPPKKLKPQPQYGDLEVNSPTPALSDVDMMDVDPEGKYISLKGSKMWKGLSDPDSEIDLYVVPGKSGDRLNLKSPGAKVAAKTLSKSAGVSKHLQKRPRSLPRKRLIDCLVEQATNQDSDDDSEKEEAAFTPDSPIDLDNRGDGNMSRSQSIVPEAPLAFASGSQSQGSQIAGPKFTYGQVRSIRAEQDPMLELAMELPSLDSGRTKARRGSIPILQPLSSFHEEEVDEDGPVAAIRNVHELRQAGANTRFLDEIEDLIERIGKPTSTQISMRRSGLLDLASKLKDKDFGRQFKANGVEQRLFVHLGQELDLISGFVMVSLLTAVLAEGNMPHIVVQLRRQGITRLLIRLLENQINIVALSKERKSNMSKVGQSLLAEHHDYLLQLPVWGELKPQGVSPRTMALKCLEKMVRQTREAGDAGDIFSKELTTNIFAILKLASAESSWDLPQGKQAIDFNLALAALESHSIMARTVHDETIWISDYLPVIADALQVAMSRTNENFGEQQFLILRLTMNVTNCNSKASDVFARPELMAMMGHVIITKFKQISRFMIEEELQVVMTHLIAVLGVMINLADGSSACRESLQSLQDKSDDPLDRMAQIWVDNQERMCEAESVEESEKNVAFGYLSVLIGYFSLLPAISERIQKRHPRRTLRPLVASIEEFIGYHKTVDQLISADDEGYSPQSGLTERLESLVLSLRALKGIGK